MLYTRSLSTLAALIAVSGLSGQPHLSSRQASDNEPQRRPSDIATDRACTVLALELVPGPGSSSEVTWEIVQQFTTTVLCSGGGYSSGISSPILETCCLNDGCYRLRVSDSGGDGFVSGAFTGGYQLRENNSPYRRIIDNPNNFTNLFGGPPDISRIASNYDNGAFCLPLSEERLIYAHCDKLDWVNYQCITCLEDPTVSAQYMTPGAATSGYEFWFFDPNGITGVSPIAYSYRRFRSHVSSDGCGSGATAACAFKINRYPGEIPQNRLLNVRVRARVNGVNGPFGPVCLFMVDPVAAACPKVHLQDNPSNVNDFSCGVTRQWGGPNSPSNRLVAKPPQFQPNLPPPCVRFQFRFRIPGENICIVRPPQTSATIHLNWPIGQRLDCFKTYEVEVRVSKTCGVGNWCVGGLTNNPANCGLNATPWGKICHVTINGPGCLVGPGSNHLAFEPEDDMTLYPNPNNGDQVFIAWTGQQVDTGLLTVDVYDLAGKRMLAKSIAVPEGATTSTLDLNGALSNGLYLVKISAGERSWTERLVVQP